ncbi:MAG: hypothetical protein ACK5Q5_20595 [Planctomycetaceae bacterium]
MMPSRRDRRRLQPAGTRWVLGVVAVLSLLTANRLWAQSDLALPAGPPTTTAPDTVVDLAADVVADNDIPPYHFSEVALTGRVDTDGRLARLKLALEMHINHAAGWYDVPLRLQQASVIGVQYEGPNKPIPVPPNDPDDGIHWLFKGAGKHRLDLDLVVELRPVSSGTNLQLTLPSGPSYFPPQLDITVPLAALSLDNGKDDGVTAVPTAAGETELRGKIQGNRVDLTWHAPMERRGSITRVLTAIALDSQEDRLRLQATQDLATDGQVSDVRVRLPTGFRLLSIAGRDYVSHEVNPQSSEWIDVHLASRERTDAQLEWLLESKSSLQPGSMLIDGFEVQGAVSQSGTVGIAPLAGFKLYRLSTEDDNGIHREEPRRLRTIRGVSQIKWAWRFDRQPLELAIELQEERPAFDIQTRAVATTRADQLDLELEYAIQVHAGRPQEFMLRWPAPGGEGWNLQSSDADVSVTDATDERSQFLGEFQRLTFSQPREGKFTLRLHYDRPLTPGPFEFSIPHIECERVLPTWLLLRGQDAVEPELELRDGQSRLTDSTAKNWLTAQDFNSDREQAYRLDDPQQPLVGVTTVFPREVRAETLVSLTRPSPQALQVFQQLQLDVKYGQLEELVFRWPDDFPVAWRAAGPAAIECRLASGEPLTAVTDGERLTVKMPEGKLGRLTVLLQYRFPLAPDAEQASIPIFVPIDHPLTSVRVEAPESGALQIEPAGDDWKRIPTALQPTWTTESAAQAFPAKLTRDVQTAEQHYGVEVLLAECQFDASGRSQMRVTYSMRNPPARVLLELPPAAEQLTAEWNGAAASGLFPDEELPDGRRIEIQLESTASIAAGRLVVAYQLPAIGDLNRFREIPVKLPTLPASVSVGLSALEIGLPNDYCLLTYPRGMSSLMEWRSGLVFQRQIQEAYANWRGQFLSAAAPRHQEQAAAQTATAGHLYAFWITGRAPSITFRTIPLWVLILVGSGLTLFLAFLLWSIPALRSVLTLLLIGFGIAVAGVFAPEAVELLLQPVLLGLLAASIAISLQSSRRVRELPAAADHSTRNERPRDSAAAGPGLPSNPNLQTTQLGVREMQESGSRS